MLKNIKALFLLFITAPVFLFAQKKTATGTGYYKKEMESLYSAIQNNFYNSGAGYYTQVASPAKGKHPYSFLWPVCTLFEAANEMAKLGSGSQFFQSVLGIMADYRDPSPPKPGYAEYLWKYRAEVAKTTDDTSRYYDDNQWIGITALDAYERTKKTEYLSLGKAVYDFMMTGYDTASGGGLYWVETSKATKNTCSNGPGIIIALKLYQITKNKGYLDTALLIYNWTVKNLRAPSGLFWDNIAMKDGRISEAIFSYNTGTMLQSNLYLYECTGNKKFLQEAQAIADSSLPFFYGNGKFRDGYWFNAVLLRGYMHLLKHNKDLKYILGFKKALDNTLQMEKNERGLFNGRNGTHDLVAHGGLLEILARFAWLESRHKLSNDKI